MFVTAHFSSQPTRIYLPPIGKIYAWTLQDDDVAGQWDKDYRHRRDPDIVNLPGTVITYKKESWVKLNPDWQRYWFRNNLYTWFGVFHESLLTPEQYTRALSNWRWLTKGTEVITNRHGWDFGKWDVILNENKGAEYISSDCLLMIRNVIRPLSTKLARIGGHTGYWYETLNRSGPVPDIAEVNAVTRPDLFPRANIILSALQRDQDGKPYSYLAPNGKLRVDPFPQAWGSGLNGHTVLLSISDDGTNLVPQNRVAQKDGELVLIDQCPNPYNPERFMNF